MQMVRSEVDLMGLPGIGRSPARPQRQRGRTGERSEPLDLNH